MRKEAQRENRELNTIRRIEGIIKKARKRRKNNREKYQQAK